MSEPRRMTCPNCEGEGIYVGVTYHGRYKRYYACNNCDGTGEQIDPRDEEPEPPKKKWWKLK